MDKVLSSWKEIAAFFGKGVRTVQRWEVKLGLPVRRPNGNDKNIVLALPTELSTWMREHTSKRGHGITEPRPKHDQADAA